MHPHKELLTLASLLVFLGGFALYLSRDYVFPTSVATLTIQDLPEGAVRVESHHEPQYDEEGNLRPEMEHYAAPGAVASGGPVYGVYGYRIIAIEYEIPADSVIGRPIGGTDPGMGLTGEFLSLGKALRYDHAHIGRSEGHDGEEGGFEIHFMFMTHEEEEKMGLSCS